MNQYLKIIQDLLQQNKMLSDAEKAALLKTITDADKQWSIIDFKLDRTEKVKKTTAILLEETIEELEQKRKAVEAQNKELEIEKALEKVRSSALSMKAPSDMLEVCRIILEQLELLNVKEIRNVQTAIFYEERGTYMNYEYYAKHKKTFITEADYTNHEVAKSFAEKMLKGKGEISVTNIEGEEKLKEWIAYQKTTNVFIDIFLETATSLHYYWFSLGPVALGISTYVALNDKELGLFKRFLNVFELAYRRYLDIEKAEAQAKEAKIEAALERVRSRTMGMQRSEELKEVIQIVYEQFVYLNINTEHAGFVMDYKVRDDHFIWVASKYGVPSHLTIPHFDCEYYNRFKEAKEKGWDFFASNLSFEEKNNFYRQLFAYIPGLPEDAKEFYFNCPGLAISTVLLENVGLYIENFDGIPYSDEDNAILMRFGKVFQQTYTRFLDLQKAEAQAREAQIEVALERVRSKAMAMHKSQDLHDAVAIVFQELDKLNLDVLRVGISVLNKEKRTGDVWLTSVDKDKAVQVYGNESFDFHPLMRGSMDAWIRQEDFYYILEGKDLTDYYKGVEAAQFGLPSSQVLSSGNEYKKQSCYVAVYNAGGLFAFREGEFPPEAKAVMKRFANVFDLTYKRFLDLQKAEAQAKESQVQLAMERVRARTMAMQHSNELLESATLLFQQIEVLGAPAWNCSFNIWLEDKKRAIAWNGTKDGFGRPFTTNSSEDVFLRFFEADQRGEKLYVEEIGGSALEQHYNYLATVPGVGETLAELKEAGIVLPSYQVFNIAYFSQGYLMFITYEPVPKLWDVFKRFANVFEQTYTRFLDLQKAEAQAREAQIEAALEKVRSRSLAMHKSGELEEVIMVVSEQLLQLQFRFHNVSFSSTNEQWETTFWLATPGRPHPFLIQLPYVETTMLTRVFEARNNGIDFFADKLTAEENQEWLQHLVYKSRNSFTEEDKKYLLTLKGLARSTVLTKHIILAIINYAIVPYTEEQNFILKRFGTVFEQAYTRFLDLQKAEAQARESQIQLALERVRARTMAMHKSEELAELSFELVKQIQALGVATWHCAFNIYDENQNNSTEWGSNAGGTYPRYKTPRVGIFRRYYEIGQTGETFHIEVIGEDRCASHYEWLCTLPGVGEELIKLRNAGVSFPTSQIDHIAYFKYGYLLFIAYEPVPEAYEIFKRFAKVFEQTYTRFLDLKKAEAQAMEAKIEASLERVRARTMAMQNSSELGDLVAILFEELTALELILARCIIWIFDADTLSARIWMANSEDKKTAESYYIKKLDHPYYDAIIQGWKEGNPKWVYDLEGGTKRSIDLLLLNETELSQLPDAVKKGILESNHTVVSGSFNNFGLIEASGPFAHTEEQLEILSRFGKVFDLGYTRFNDLKQAEAQAREAHIETALEKVRSRTLAMQKSDELAETAAVLFKQLIHLGIAPNRLYIGIIKDDIGHIEFWITDEDGSKVSTMFSGDATRNASMKKMYDGWKEQHKSISIDMQGKELNDYFHYLGEELHVPFKDGLVQKRRLQYIAYFSKGFVGIASPDEQPVETVELLERFASAFNLTFTRFNDLKVAEAHALQAEQDLIEIKAARKKAEDTLTELQATQKQLIQSEKMASLGELTAGIAHEIQNPLNFVNNFSDVSNELIAEMVEEIEKGNYEEAKSIAEDVKQNLQKINHHGRRADAIVKGMLQHSRTSSGVKEPTDINALTDEYLRLAYHGLRARDKAFNSILKTDFDPGIGKINIISQDMGRVILNLITNAFYAVGEKKKQHASAISAEQRYEPTVSVSTKKVNSNVEIHIADNGNGIPKSIIDKIFQPFFTTKPTGQGTGLGLSLAYDIVKAHGGELRADTKEGEGSEFIIQLPII